MERIEEIIDRLSRKQIQLKILTGFMDAINGYGWHAVYSFTASRTERYCQFCRSYYAHNCIESDELFEQHRHNWNDKTISFHTSELHHSFQSFIKALDEFEKNTPFQESLTVTKLKEIASVNVNLVPIEKRIFRKPNEEKHFFNL